MLCNLYKYYFEAAKDHASRSPEIHSVPASPLVPTTDSLNPPSSATVRRTGSIGSILDSSHGQAASAGGRGGGGRSVFRRGHRRAHSGPNNEDDSSNSPSSRDTRANTIAIGSTPTTPHRSSTSSSSVSISDPFDQLETVWSSLESWFDLLVSEVEKTRNQVNQKQGAKKPDVSVTTSDAASTSDTGTPDKPLPPSEDEEQPKMKKKPNLRLPSSELAAAIVNSIPVERRNAFLKPSISFEGHLRPRSRARKEFADKRKSWHVDRVAARYLSVVSPENSCPEFNRSLSSDSELSKCIHAWVV